MTTLDIPGSPGGLEALAGQLENAANDIDAVRDRVATNGLDGEWNGQAADAFRSTLHRLPGELGTVSGAFGDATGTIRSFAGRLAELQQQAQWYEEKLEESERDLREANARHDEATANLRSATRAQTAAADPVSLHAAKQLVERGESMARQALADVEDIGGKLSQLNSGADSIRHEYEEAIRSCCSALEAANPPGESMWSGLRHGFDDMTGGAIRLGSAVWRGADRGLHDAEKDLDEAGHFAIKEFDYYWAGVRRIIVDTTNVLSDTTLILGVVMGAAGVIAVATGAGAPLGAALIAGAGVELEANEAISKEGYGLAAAGDAVAVGTSQTEAEKAEYRRIAPEDTLSLAMSWVPGGEDLPKPGERVLLKPVTETLGRAVLNWETGNVAQKVLNDAESLQLQRPAIAPPLEVPSVFRIVLPSPASAVA
jgi:uncharacterized protein YukE